MTRGRPATPEERARMGHRLIPATDLTERHMDRTVRAGTVVGRLIGTYPKGDQVVLTLLVGDPAVRAFVPVGVGDEVEVWRQPTNRQENRA